MRHRIYILLLCLLCLSQAKAQDIFYATFNIRYAGGDRHTQRDWTLRKDSLAHFIQAHKISVCGMQEVLHEQMNDLRKLLPEYDYVGVAREDGKKKGEYAPIFYLSQEWEALKSGTFWLSETPEVAGSMGWDAACTRIATWALLKHRKSGKQIMAINTHFDHVGNKARVESGKLILKKASELAQNVPLVLTGDFNVGMESDVYRSITHHADFPITDTFRTGAPHEGIKYTWHNFAKLPVEQCNKIDFIFVSPTIEVLRTFIPAESRQPDAFLMSDHNPFIAILRLPSR